MPPRENSPMFLSDEWVNHSLQRFEADAYEGKQHNTTIGPHSDFHAPKRKYFVDLKSPRPEYPKLRIIQLIEQEKWSDVERHVKNFPQEARTPTTINFFGEKAHAFALHALCRRRYVPESIVKTLISVYPDAIRQKESTTDCLSIHIACRSKASPGVIRILIDEFPESAWTKDKDGNLPLHYACSLATPEIFYLLLETNPYGVRAQNLKKHLPLHLACGRSDASTEVIKTLVQAHKEGCLSADWRGRIPLHSASIRRAPMEAIDCLIDSYPESVRVRDLRGFTPYGLCKKTMGMSVKDPVVQRLRRAMGRTGNIFIRGKDIIQFQVENIGSFRAAIQ